MTLALPPSLLPFLVVAALIVVTPGPDMALVTRNAIASGRAAALATALGVVSGLLVWTAASLVGLAAILRASALVFAAVKLAGAAYLAYLGLRTLWGLRPGRGRDSSPPGGRRRRAPGGTPYRQGLLSNLLNPKIAALFTSLIPQFVQPGDRAAFESVVLGFVFAGVGLAWLTCYACFAAAASGLLRRPRVRSAVDAVTGTVLIGLGARLAVERR